MKWAQCEKVKRTFDILNHQWLAYNFNTEEEEVKSEFLFRCYHLVPMWRWQSCQRLSLVVPFEPCPFSRNFLLYRSSRYFHHLSHPHFHPSPFRHHHHHLQSLHRLGPRLVWVCVFTFDRAGAVIRVESKWVRESERDSWSLTRIKQIVQMKCAHRIRRIHRSLVCSSMVFPASRSPLYTAPDAGRHQTLPSSALTLFLTLSKSKWPQHMCTNRPYIQHVHSSDHLIISLYDSRGSSSFSYPFVNLHSSTQETTESC